MRAGLIALQIAKVYVDRMILVPDDEIVRARHAIWDEVRLAAEPGAAAPVAALLTGAYIPAPDERVALVICGANADPADLTIVEV
jgi:threonine dehydratase